MTNNHKKVFYLFLNNNYENQHIKQDDLKMGVLLY